MCALGNTPPAFWQGDGRPHGPDPATPYPEGMGRPDWDTQGAQLQKGDKGLQDYLAHKSQAGARFLPRGTRLDRKGRKQSQRGFHTCWCYTAATFRRGRSHRGVHRACHSGVRHEGRLARLAPF